MLSRTDVAVVGAGPARRDPPRRALPPPRGAWAHDGVSISNNGVKAHRGINRALNDN
ncbi:MAG: hypothetical protein JWO72_2548 [Caulobacteraceae bacterium]|nr:hypothetical protein [Caulobacteraceae bacterium]